MASLKIGKAYSRRLSASERFALAINELYRYNIVALAEGTGTITRQELQMAVDTASAHNPGVRVRLKYFLGFTKWVDSGISPEVKEIEASEWDSCSEKGCDFLETGFRPLNGDPVCDFFLIRGKTTRIVARALHAAMDARGMQHLIKDIFRVLRGEPLVGSHSELTDTDIALRFQDKIQATRKEMNCIPILKLDGPKPSNLRYIWRRVALNKNIGNLMPKTAVFLAQYAHKERTGDVGFTIPVDMRGLRADEISTANLTGYLRIKIEAEDNPMTIMQQINQGIRAYADCSISPLMKTLPWVPILWLIRDLKKNVGTLLYEATTALPSGGIVSMGMFRPEEFSCPSFTAQTCIGIPGSVGKMNVVIMNHVDHTEVVFSTPEAYNTSGQLDTMIKEYRAYLNA